METHSLAESLRLPTHAHQSTARLQNNFAGRTALLLDGPYRYWSSAITMPPFRVIHCIGLSVFPDCYPYIQMKTYACREPKVDESGASEKLVFTWLQIR